jgi:hypothetical protein
VHVAIDAESSCPICLEPPTAARLTQCGHVYCWPCIKRLLAVSGRRFAPCPICTNIITSSIGNLKPAVVHVQDPVRVDGRVEFVLMRREKGSSAVLRASSLSPEQLAAPGAGAGAGAAAARFGGAPLERGHRDALFARLTVAGDAHGISRRERAELSEALELAISSGEAEMVPFLEACLRELDEEDAVAAGAGGAAAASEPALASPGARAPSSPLVASTLSPSAAPWQPQGARRAASKLWVGGECHEVGAPDEEEGDHWGDEEEEEEGGAEESEDGASWRAASGSATGEEAEDASAELLTALADLDASFAQSGASGAPDGARGERRTESAPGAGGAGGAAAPAKIASVDGVYFFYQVHPRGPGSWRMRGRRARARALRACAGGERVRRRCAGGGA